MLKLLIAVSSFGESLRWEFLTGSAETVFFLDTLSCNTNSRLRCLWRL